MKVINGDLIKLALDSRFNIIAHGCNLKKNFGAGIALQIKKTFPEAYLTDKEAVGNTLGDISTCNTLFPKLTIVNCYTQIYYGKPYGYNSRNTCKADTVDARYVAIEKCMNEINILFPNKTIGLPKIGSGLAGLDWNKIEQIIEQTLTNLDVTIVNYKK